MGALDSFVDGVKPQDIMPDLQVLMGHLAPLMKWLVRLGPVILLAFGLIYLLAPPKEANHTVGFRTYFGMGSVEAWQYTQHLAGTVLSILGGVLTAVMWAISFTFSKLETFAMMNRAARCLIWQFSLVLITYIALGIVAAVRFDRHGNPRK